MKSLLSIERLLSCLIAICIVLLLTNCKCDDRTDPDCPNYDPCYDVEEPIANFGAGYKYVIPGEGDDYFGFFRDTTIYFDGDTIPGYPTFYAYDIEEVDSFYWQVGSDPRTFRGDEFGLRFGSERHGEHMDVTLIVLKESNCFVDGYIRDTLTRTFIISSDYRQSNSVKRLNSAYAGESTEFPGEDYSIEIMEAVETGRLKGFPRGTYGRTGLYLGDYDELYFTGQNDSTIWLAGAYFDVNNRKKLVINYKISYDLGKTSKWYKYVGYRVE